MKKLIVIGIMLISILANRIVFAEMTVREFRLNLSGDKYAKTAAQAFIQGVVVGIGWVNTELESNKEEPLFCIPQGRVLNGNEIVEIMNKYVEKRPEGILDMPVGIVLLKSFMEKYPCKKD